MFAETRIVPCGPRKDKPTSGLISEAHRQQMADLAFRGIPRATIVSDDLEAALFTTTSGLIHLFQTSGFDPVIIVGSDLIRGGKRREAEIFRWYNGTTVWNKARFGVIRIEGQPFNWDDLPPLATVIGTSKIASSTEIRRRVAAGAPISDLVPPDVAAYIAQHNLYR